MTFIKIEPVRSVAMSGLLGDLASQLSAQQYRVYSDPDLVTTAHEVTHGICSRIRNQLRVRNAYYCFNNLAFTTDVSGVTLRSVANAIERQYRGTHYQLYLVDQQRYWNEDAAYIVEELVCYLNGAAVGVEKQIERRTTGSFQSACEFLFYVTKLHELTENQELKSFIDFVYHRMKQTKLNRTSTAQHYESLVDIFYNK